MTCYTITAIIALFLMFSACFRYFMTRYENVFVGKDFVKWLLRENIVSDREEGLRYGQALLYGRVIAHVHREHYFHCSTFFYEFL